MEDIGRGVAYGESSYRTTQSLLTSHSTPKQATWIAKAPGIVAGLPIAIRVFQLLDPQVQFIYGVPEGSTCASGDVIVEITGSLDSLLMGQIVALNLAMRLSGIATLTCEYVAQLLISHFP